MSWFNELKRSIPTIVVAAALTGTGCYASVTSDAYVEARVPPPRIHAVPRARYDGRVVYLVEDRWYFYDDGGWYYYRVEPEPLVYERRTIRTHHHVHEAPPAYRRRHRHYHPPHRHHDNAPAFPRTAPPAERVH